MLQDQNRNLKSKLSDAQEYFVINTVPQNSLASELAQSQTSLRSAAPYSGKLYRSADLWPGKSGLVPNWVRLAPNGTDLELFKISFSTFWLVEPIWNQPGLAVTTISI